MANESTVYVRVGVRDADRAVAALRGLGIEGERAGRRIADSAEPASRGLRALAAGMTEARGGAEGLAGRVGPLGGVLSAIGPGGLAAAAGLGAAAAAAVALAGAARRAIDTMAEVQRTADIAGVTAEKWQEMEYVGSRFGVTADAMADALKELALRSDEFAVTGAGPAAEAFQRLGMGTAEVNERMKDTPAFLTEVVKRLQGLDAAAQIRIADELFGGQGGEQFFGLIQAGGDAIDGLRRHVRDLGATYDADVLGRAKDLSRELSDQSRVIDTNLNTALVAAGPLLVKLSEGAAAAARTVRDLAEAWGWLGEESERGQLFDARELIVQRRKILDEIEGLETRLAEGQGGDWVGLRAQVMRPQIEARIAALREQAEALRADYDALMGKITAPPPAPPALVPPGGDDGNDMIVQRAALLADLATAEEAARKAYEDRLAKIAELEKGGGLDAGEAARLRARAEEELAEALKKVTAADSKAAAEAARKARAAADARDAIARQVDGLKDEREQVGMTERARAVHVEVLKAEETARRGGIALTEDMRAALEREAGALFDRAAAADRVAEAERKREEAAKEAARELERQARAATDDLVAVGADAIDTIFDSSKPRDFWAEAVDYARAALSRMAAEALMRPILQPVVYRALGVEGGGAGGGAAGGGGAGAAGGVAGGIGDLWGSVFGAMPKTSIFGDLGGSVAGFLDKPLFALSSPLNAGQVAQGAAGIGTGSLAQSSSAMGLPGAPGAGGTFTFGNALGAAGLGLNSFMNFKQGNVVGGIGNLAATAMMFIPGLQPFAPIVGLISSMLGGLFKKEKHPAFHAAIGAGDEPGRFAVTDYAQKHFSDDMPRQVGEAMATAANAAVEMLLGSEARLVGGERYALGYDQKEDTYRVHGNGADILAEFGSDRDAAIADLVFRAIKGGDYEGIGEDIAATVRNSAAANLDDLAADLAFTRGRNALFDAPEVVGQYEAAVRGLTDAMDQARAKAESLGVSTDEMQADFIAALKRVAEPESGAGPVARALDDLRQAMEAARQAAGDLADDVAKPFAAAMEAVREGLRASLQSALDEAQGRGYRNSLRAALSDYATAEGELRAAGDDDGLARALLVERLGAILSGLDAEGRADALALVKREAADLSEVLGRDLAPAILAAAAAARDGADAATEEAAAEEARARAEARAAEARGAYVTGLQGEAARLRSVADAWRSIGDAAARAADALKLDGALSPLSPSAALDEARRQFQEVRAAALAGDRDAAARLPEVARMFLQASRAANHDQAAYLADWEDVQRTLRDQAARAEEQVSAAERNVSLLEDQLEALGVLTDAVRGGLGGMSTAISGGLAALAEAFRTASAGSGGSGGGAGGGDPAAGVITRTGAGWQWTGPNGVTHQVPAEGLDALRGAHPGAVVRAYWTGGYIAPGDVGLVGETGRPELVAGPAYVGNPEVTRRLMGGPDAGGAAGGDLRRMGREVAAASTSGASAIVAAVGRLAAAVERQGRDLEMLARKVGARA